MKNIESFFDIEKELHCFQKQVPTNFSTRLIHVGQEPEQWKTRSVVPPIHTSCTYQLENQEDYRYLYTRVSNPSRDVLQKVFANINNAKHALMFSSGQAATSTLMVTLGTGTHVVMAKHIYGASASLFINEGAHLGIECSFVDFSDVDNITGAIKENTKLVFFESPSNPILKCFDIAAIAKAVHAKKSDVLVVVDNTFMSPYYQLPLDLGADVTMYSASKYVNGHNDVVHGALVMNDDSLFERIKKTQIRLGGIPSPFDCYLVLRGLKTLPLRMQQHFRNSLIVAKFLKSHPAVEKVSHPAFKDHPTHHIAIKQAAGHSGMVCFWIKNANLKINQEVLKKLKVFTVTGSLGGPDSLIVTPILVSAESQPKELREDVEITESCVRVSVGLEDAEDLIEDLNQALNTLL